jgi:hypothetical protein
VLTPRPHPAASQVLLVVVFDEGELLRLMTDP